MKKLIGMLLAGVFTVAVSSTAWSQESKSEKKMRKSEDKARKAAGKPTTTSHMTSHSYYGYNSHTKVKPDKTKTKYW